MRATFAKAAAVAYAATMLAVGGCTCQGSSPGGSTASGSGSNAVSPENAPRIVAVQPVFDFGKVRSGKEVEHVFKIRNDGRSNLLLESARGS